MEVVDLWLDFVRWLPKSIFFAAQGFQIPPATPHESLPVTIGWNFPPDDPVQHMPAKLPKDHPKTAGITLPGPGKAVQIWQIFRMEVACGIPATNEEIHKSDAQDTSLAGYISLEIRALFTAEIMNLSPLGFSVNGVPEYSRDFGIIFPKGHMKKKKISGYTFQTHLRVIWLSFSKSNSLNIPNISQLCGSISAAQIPSWCSYEISLLGWKVLTLCMLVKSHRLNGKNIPIFLGSLGSPWLCCLSPMILVGYSLLLTWLQYAIIPMISHIVLIVLACFCLHDVSWCYMFQYPHLWNPMISLLVVPWFPIIPSSTQTWQLNILLLMKNHL